MRIRYELTQEEREAALRFCETCQDNEGYDVPKPMMKRLAELGLVKYKGFGRYEQTDLILALEDEDMAQKRALAGTTPIEPADSLLYPHFGMPLSRVKK